MAKKNSYYEDNDCNDSNVRKSVGRVSCSKREASQEHDEIGGMTEKFLKSKKDRINGQSY